MKAFRYLLAGAFLSGMTMVAADEAPEEQNAPPPPPPAEEAPPPPAEPAPPPPAEEPPPPPAEEAAAPAEPTRKLYAGLGLALIQGDIDGPGGGKATVTGANARLGYMLWDWLAVEGQVIQGFTTPDLDKVVGTDEKLGTTWGVFVKPNHTFGPINLFATLGYADVDLKVRGPGGGQVGDKGFAYGIGSRIPTAKGAFDFEYLNLLDEDDASAQGLEFSYSYFFW